MADFFADPTLAGVADPYPVYAELRAQAPAHWCPGPQLWAILGHDAAAQSFRDPVLDRSLERSHLAQVYGQSDIYDIQKMDLPYMDGERHRIMRRHVINAYHAIDFKDLAALLRAFVDDRLSGVGDLASFDLITVLAADLPLFLVSSLIGIPPSRQQQAADAVAPFVAARGLTQDAATAADADRAVATFEETFLPLIQERRTQPTGDLTSRLISDPIDGMALTDREMLVLLSSNFYAASTFTLRLFVGTLAMAMATHPTLYQRVRADRSLIPACVDEVLRWDPPAQAVNVAVATSELRYGDVVIPAGAAVTTLVGAANRDPAVFAEPEVLRLDRDPRHNLTFAPGIHQCLGIHVARLAAATTLAAFADHLPEFGYNPQTSRRLVADRFRGWESLIIER